MGTHLGVPGKQELRHVPGCFLPCTACNNLCQDATETMPPEALRQFPAKVGYNFQHGIVKHQQTLHLPPRVSEASRRAGHMRFTGRNCYLLLPTRGGPSLGEGVPIDLAPGARKNAAISVGNQDNFDTSAVVAMVVSVVASVDVSAIVYVVERKPPGLGFRLRNFRRFSEHLIAPNASAIASSEGQSPDAPRAGSRWGSSGGLGYHLKVKNHWAQCKFC
ncbi:hypothetical protein Q9L58_008113 [Maublancomyces gigas]|uniref:Uncharacterized protein n=1 Tax=Discina gigas TaxID=1032678 RepID=A0ABR3GAN5_9PEZI